MLSVFFPLSLSLSCYWRAMLKEGIPDFGHNLFLNFLWWWLLICLFEQVKQFLFAVLSISFHTIQCIFFFSRKREKKHRKWKLSFHHHFPALDRDYESCVLFHGSHFCSYKVPWPVAFSVLRPVRLAALLDIINYNTFMAAFAYWWKKIIIVKTVKLGKLCEHCLKIRFNKFISLSLESVRFNIWWVKIPLLLKLVLTPHWNFVIEE